MTHILSEHPVCGAPAARGALLRLSTNVLARAGALVRHAVILVRNRLDMHALAQFDERMLKDIGLTQSDVQGALNEPWHKDPSRMLRIKSVQHRALMWSHLHGTVSERAACGGRPSRAARRADA